MTDTRLPWHTRLLEAAKPSFRPLYRAFILWDEADGLRMSAAMSFYGVLSLAPLLVLLVAVLGWWMDRSVIETNLIAQIGGVIGDRGADVIKQALHSSREPSEGLIASLFAFILLLVGATGVFAELQAAFERLWTNGTGQAANQKWWYTATLRLRGIAYILAFGFLLLVSLAISTILDMVADWAGAWVAVKQLLFIVNEAVSFGFCTFLFVALMRMSAGPKPGLRHLALGAAIGASLFTGGKHVLATYLSSVAVVSAYGAAGSLIVLLMWIYFTSAILLYSAGVARAVSDEVREQAAPGTVPALAKAGAHGPAAAAAAVPQGS